MTRSHHHADDAAAPFWKSRISIATIMLTVIGLFYVVGEHYGHALQILPYLILLLCPLMHLFGHNRGVHSSTDTVKDETRE
ncbi:MAG: hypothetical protein A3J25_21025 [Pseudomonadales bacterium RIFCSPLOWO2_02_FULL_63_210]|nr:MAG: hypothetical protein A3J25_21025 [Pseudomonadales bacterium RIFCSPLOWO2_02_FULL_63_210]